MKDIHTAKCDGMKLFYSWLREVGSCNSSVSNLDKFKGMKEKTKSELSSDLAIVTFSATKEFVKATKEAGVDANP